MWKSDKPINNLTEFLDLTEKFRKRFQKDYDSTWAPWFRGEPDVLLPTRLQPNLYRNSKRVKDLLYVDQELRNEFVRRAAHLVPQGGNWTHWDWYSLMQHFEVPTRLLDWTDNALVALYFAVKDPGPTNPIGQPPAAVYVLDPWWLNDRAFKSLGIKSKASGVAVTNWDEAKPYLSEDPFDSRLDPVRPLAVMPTHVSARIAAQKSEFIIFGKDKNSLQRFAEGPLSRLGVISIAADKLPAIMGELDAVGISEASVYPDLQGLGRDLKRKSAELIREARRTVKS